MPRLIDANALIKDNGLERATKYGNRSPKQQTTSYSTMMLYEIVEMIDEAPTVEAIPIEWIKKWLEDIPLTHRYRKEITGEVKNIAYNGEKIAIPCISDMLEDWEKENGR